MDSINHFRSQAQLLKVLAHPTRLRLLYALRGGEQCVCHLTALLEERQAYVSQQLMYLRRAGLLQDRKEGSRVYYRIRDKRLLHIIETMKMSGPRAKSSERQRIAFCPCPKCGAVGQQGKKKAR